MLVLNNATLVKPALVLLLLTFILLGAGHSNFVESQSFSEGKMDSHASLTLTTNVTGQTSCSNGDVRLFLRFKFTNTGTEPIILQKYSVGTTGYLVSRSLEAAKKRQFEEVVHLFESVATFNPTHGPKPPPDKFVILAPTECYEFDTKTFQFVFTIYNRDHPKRLKEGSHFVQFDVMTWDEDSTLAKELAVGWRKYGTLWLKGVRSEPMEFTIEKSPSTQQCY